jgi:hypothetical protein
MFARQLSRTVPRVLPKGTVLRFTPTSVRTLGALSSRSFQSTRAQQQAAAAADQADEPWGLRKKEDDGSLSHIISQYGTYPFIGLLGFSLLSKEIMLFDEEFMLFGVWGAVVLTGYINLGDSVHKYFQDQIDERAQRIDDIMDMAVEGVNVYKTSTKWQMDAVGVVDDMLKEYENVLEVSYKAKNVALRNAAHDAMLAQLQRVKTQEDLAAAKANEEMVQFCMDGVRADFAEGKITPQLKSGLLEDAISRIGTDPSAGTLKEDPLYTSFEKYVKAFQAKK